MKSLLKTIGIFLVSLSVILALFDLLGHLWEIKLILFCMKKIIKKLPIDVIDRIIEMAWEDRTTFDAISQQFDISEKEVIDLMRNQLKPSSYRL